MYRRVRTACIKPAQGSSSAASPRLDIEKLSKSIDRLYRLRYARPQMWALGSYHTAERADRGKDYA